MNARALAILSLVINVALLVAAWNGRRSVPVARPTGAAAAMAGAGAGIATPSRDPRADASNETPGDSLPGASVFHWSQVASTDFAAYRDRLRALGCPDRTVRDILTAEINRHFEERRAEVIAGLQGQFWNALARHVRVDDMFKEDLEPLKNERREMLNTVLGGLPEDDPAAGRARQLAEWQREYHWLPAEKQGRLAAIEAQAGEGFEALEREIRELPPHEQQAERLRRRAAREAELTAERKAALTDDEWAEYQLRQSPAGRWVAGTVGFAVTDTEWRTVATALKDFDSRPSETETGPLTTTARQAQAEARQREREQALATALGPERYAEYQRSRDTDFQQLRRLTGRLNLEDASAVAAFELKQALAEEMRQLEAQAALSAEERRTVEQALRAQAREAVGRTLGADGLEAYLENGGGWLRDPGGE